MFAPVFNCNRDEVLPVSILAPSNRVALPAMRESSMVKLPLWATHAPEPERGLMTWLKTTDHKKIGIL